MAPLPPLVTLTKQSGNNFNYRKLQAKGSTRVPGAVRVVGVDGLLQPDPNQVIRVYQFANTYWGNGQETRLQNQNRQNSNSKFIAISHIWSNGVDVDKQLDDMIDDDPTKELLVDVDGDDGKDDTNRLSWDGLRQAANAVKQLGADYMWLDFLCLDQKKRTLPNGKDDKEKALQICIMGDIFTYAYCVVTMIGGIGAVTGIDQTTGWMDRAWTLQEAIVNKNETYVYVSCPKGQRDVDVPGRITSPWTFERVDAEEPFTDANTSLYLITLMDLLDLADTNPYPTDQAPPVNVLNGAFDSVPSDSPRRALRAALSNYPRIKHTGVWRSMFMRTSSHPVDVVYSIMGIFKLQIDPYRNNRAPKDLFADLARKTAALVRCGPSWLTIGGVYGTNIPRDYLGVVPEFPHYEKAGETSANDPPQMWFADDTSDWVGYQVDDTQYYISKFDMQFMTQSFPHIINCIMLPVRGPLRNRYNKKIPRPGGGKPDYIWRKSADFSMGPLGGTCIYNGDLASAVQGGRVQAAWVGEVGDMRDADVDLDIPVTKVKPVKFKGWQYFLFLDWTAAGWEVVADGAYKPTRGWPLPRDARRWLFTVGQGAQRKIWRWPAPNETWKYGQRWLDRRTWKSGVVYGLEPLADYRVKRPSTRKISWFNHKWSMDVDARWKTYTMGLDISDLVKQGDKKLNRTLASIRSLPALSTVATAGLEPRTIKTRTTFFVAQEGAMPITISYDGWSKSQCANLAKAGVEGILIAEDDKGNPATKFRYHIRLRLGEEVMYIEMKPHWDTRFEFWQIFAVPYSTEPGRGSVIVNRDYRYSPPPTPVPAPPVVNPNPYPYPAGSLYPWPYGPGYGYGAGMGMGPTPQPMQPHIIQQPQPPGPSPGVVWQTPEEVAAGAAASAQLQANMAAERASWGRRPGQGGCG